jgi:hypothetical protein
LAEIANKKLSKSMLAEYELGLMYEKQEDFKKAAKRYQASRWKKLEIYLRR